MPEVQTVRGPIDAAELGRALAHEHVVTQDQIDTMLVGNPRRYFEGAA